MQRTYTDFCLPFRPFLTIFFSSYFFIDAILTPACIEGENYSANFLMRILESNFKVMYKKKKGLTNQHETAAPGKKVLPILRKYRIQ